MRRAGRLFERVASFQALLAAARVAARDKRTRPEVARFLLDQEPECLQLERELLDGTYRPRPYRTFTIHEPKRRTISAAAFRDRVVHHALCAAMAPVMERSAIARSYACRAGKGTHAAVVQAGRWQRQHAFALKMDVEHFFETASHDVLRQMLARRFKDARLLDLAGRFIDFGAPGSVPGRGLPIGNLTSQHFADDKPSLWAAARAIATFCDLRLGLAVKREATLVVPRHEGLPFLGFRLWPSLVRRDGARKRRFFRKMRAVHRGWAAGTLAEETASRVATSLVGHVSHANTLRLRRSFFDRLHAFDDPARRRRRAGGRTVPRRRTRTGRNRVVRGGSWNNDARNLRVSNRNNDDPGNRNTNNGFRLSSSRPSLMAGLHGVRPCASSRTASRAWASRSCDAESFWRRLPLR